ncbi:MAG: MFS transporter [Candidatus Methanomethylicaceae archaeon]|nr:MFS transporter [Candidatus Verstraetearchaeota archaeon]
MKERPTVTPQREVKIVALLTTTSASFLTPFISSATNIALPNIGLELGLDTVMLGWVQTSFLLTTAVFLLPFGKVADIVGRKKIFLVGLIVYTTSSLLASIADSALVLIVSRIFQGIGGAMLAATSVAILSSVFPPQDRGKVLGINVASVYTSIALGPFLGGILTQHFGWRSIFYMNVFVALLTLMIALRLRQEWKGTPEERFDILGSLLYGISLATIMWGTLSFSSYSGGYSRLPFYAILIGTFTMACLVVWEGRIKYPVFDIRLFINNLNFSLSNISALINYAATYALSFLLSIYLQIVKGLTPQVAGTILVAQPILQALLSPMAGWLSDRIEPGKVASVGIALNAIGLFVLSTINADTEIMSIVAILVLMGIGFALFSSPNTNAIMSSVERGLFGVASAILSTMRTLGQTFSIALATLVLSIFVGSDILKTSNLGDFISGMRFAFLIFAVLCVIGVFTSLSRSKKRIKTGV